MELFDSFPFSILLVLHLLVSYPYSWLALHSLPLGPFFTTILLIQAATSLLAFSFSSLEFLRTGRTQRDVLERSSTVRRQRCHHSCWHQILCLCCDSCKKPFCQRCQAPRQYIRSQHCPRHRPTISYYRCIHLLLTVATSQSMAVQLSCILLPLLCPLQPITLQKIDVITVTLFTILYLNPIVLWALWGTRVQRTPRQRVRLQGTRAVDGTMTHRCSTQLNPTVQALERKEAYTCLCCALWKSSAETIATNSSLSSPPSKNCSVLAVWTSPQLDAAMSQEQESQQPPLTSQADATGEGQEDEQELKAEPSAMPGNQDTKE
ncbi:uncharacterized protein LOC104912662 isoform X2 [Meleagris gallopavo]|uniref:uncharacterized protein LOC104912662 isoform X2 n=1 Tax=Meleagris gallopavo TaxID=9103 RepID=UPI00093F6FA1|nr:uncharacterized protein LOC104912662 isoform X2 [Meleagris gallopavo]